MNGWLEQRWASTQAARDGGVMRLSVNSPVDQRTLAEECRKKGFRLLESGGYWIIICHKGEVRIIV